MGGSGGSAGAVSFPAYMQFFHGAYLNAAGADTFSISVADAIGTAQGASPYSGYSAYDPDTDLGLVDTYITALDTLITAMNYSTDFTNAFNLATSSFILGVGVLDTVTERTATLDTTTERTASLDTTVERTASLDTTTERNATLDTTTERTASLDAITVTDADIEADIAALDSILTLQLENIELPKFRAGMLNINAIQSSSYVLGEALLRSYKNIEITKHGTILRIELNKQAREINARHTLAYRELQSKYGLTFDEITQRYKTQYRELQSKYGLTFDEITYKYKNQYREIAAKYGLTFDEFTSRYKIQYRELQSKYGLTFDEFTSKYHNQYRDIQSKYGLTADELNTRFKLQRREIDQKYYIHRQENIKITLSEILTLMKQKVAFKLEGSKIFVDSKRIKIVAKSEEVEDNIKIAESDAKWDLDLFAYANSALGAISGGGGGHSGPKKPSKAVSALGGALSGAAMGAQLGSEAGLIGVAVGAVVGAGVGYFTA